MLPLNKKTLIATPILRGTASQYWRGDKSFQPLTTTAVVEGSNQYFTSARTVAALPGAVSTVLTSNLIASRALVSDAAGKVSQSSVTVAELSHVSGTTSSIQTQLGAKEASIPSGTASQYWRGDKSFQPLTTTAVAEGSNQYFTSALTVAALPGAVSTVLISNLTPSRALVSDAAGKVSQSSVTVAELGHVSGTTSSIQTQLGAKEASIPSGTASQYWRGDKSFQPLTTTAVAEGSNQYFTSERTRAALPGAVSSVIVSNVAANKVLISNASGKIANSNVTSTEVAFLEGVTSSIQSQFTNKQTNIPQGLVSQYWRGDKSFQTLDTSAVAEGSQLYFSGARVISALPGALSNYLTINMAGRRVLVTDPLGKIDSSSVTVTELSYIAGATSNIQDDCHGEFSMWVVGGGERGGGHVR